MSVSRLTVFLFFVGVVFIFIGGLFDIAGYVFLAYNLVLLLLVVIDYKITPGKKSIEVIRECDKKFSLGVENNISLCIKNRSSSKIKVKVADEIPEYIESSDLNMEIIVNGFSDAKASYYVIPRKRGEYIFGNVHVKYSGILKLCSKYYRCESTESYKVYPNMRDLSRVDFRDLKKALVVDGVLRNKVYGIGTEFESLREYNIDDDYRKLNWMATARSNKLIVNNYDPEKNQHIYILMDSSRVMNSEINYIKKLDYAINASLMLAEFALKKGDLTGLLVFDSEIRRHVKPNKGIKHFQSIADSLYNIKEEFVSADYNMAMSYLYKNQRKRGLLCIFTELTNIEETKKIIKALKVYSAGYSPLVITIKDTGLNKILTKNIKDSDDVFDKIAADKFVQERQKMKKMLSASNIPCIDVEPDKLSIAIINKYLGMKSSMKF